MKRTKAPSDGFQVDLILTADWHLRESIPTCRTDDFIESQWKKVAEVSRLQKKHNCPVFHAGDLFHHWKPSPELLSRCIKELPDRFCTVYGNHDLPQHSMDLEYKSGVRTLVEANVVELLKEGHWNQPPKQGERLRYDDLDSPNGHGFRRIAVWHTLVWTHKTPYPGAEEEEEGHALLDKLSSFDLILTGDNHQSFICRQDGRILVNPGSLTRQEAGQKFFEPCVYLYNAKTNMAIAHYFNVDPEDVSRIHIEEKKDRDERIEAFVQKLETDWEGSLDFTKNLRQIAKENKIENSVVEIALKALDQ